MKIARFSGWITGLLGFVNLAHAQIDGPGACETLNAVNVPTGIMRLATGGVSVTTTDYVSASARTTAVSTTMVAEYYRSIVAEMGEAAADDVIRLFVGPGGTHNGNWVAQTDMLGLLEAWVEEGEAPPSEIPVHDIDPKTLETRRSMVACVYPMYTRYDGVEDINESASYSCSGRHDPLAYGSQDR